MRQVSIKINSYARNVNIINNSNLEKKVFNCLLGVLGALAVSYVFIIGNITINVIERKALLEEAHAISNEVGALELSYLSLSSSVDLDLSYAMGYKEVKTNFATRKPLGAVVLPEFYPNSLAYNKNTSSIKLAKNEF